MQRNNKLFLLQKLLAFIGLELLFATAYAGIPLWTFEPLQATTIAVRTNETIIVQYRVTNQSSKPHTLIMQPIQGIKQITTGVNICGNPFMLTSKNSCILSLEINGSRLNSPISGGPVVCQQEGLNQCYRPSNANMLRITQSVLPSDDALISVTAPIQQNRIIKVNDTPLNLTISNDPSSLANANGVTVTNHAACPNIVVDDSNCASIPPGGSCNLSLSSTVPYVPCTLTISGTNTGNSLTALIAFSYLDGLVFETTGGSGKVLMDEPDGFESPWTQTVEAINANSPTNGSDNTDAIINSTSCTDNPNECAALLCYNTDLLYEWYLPARNELASANSVFCSNGYPCDFGNFIQNAGYYTSTEIDTDYALAYAFVLDAGASTSKTNPLPVRCVRAYQAP